MLIDSTADQLRAVMSHVLLWKNVDGELDRAGIAFRGPGGHVLTDAWLCSSRQKGRTDDLVPRVCSQFPLYRAKSSGWLAGWAMLS